ncbi:hypothetical protein AGMMS49944_18350 [Spirochaetia bacterium]|nr:hypothetical protein AGMMS49944_18350 [Spirochaetia bacterium]
MNFDKVFEVNDSMKRVSPHPDDYLYESFHLQEMAYPPSKIIDKLLQWAEPRLEHLLKLYYFRKFDRYAQGWMSSVFKCTIQTYKDNRTNKWPTQEFLFENLWTNEEDAFEAHHKGFLGTFASYKDLPKIENPDVNGSAAFCKSYFEWLSQELSAKGSVTLDEVKQKLEELLGL